MADKNNTLPIGFFDSGVGGLSVYARFKELLPSENTLYYGDLLHLPYGNKAQTELIGYARNILNFYKNQTVKAVVIACNTSSAQAYDTIKNEYDFKIYPIIQSCAKVLGTKYDSLGVFATEATVKAGVYTRELTKYNENIKVHEIPCKDWVSIVEGTCDNIESAKTGIKTKIENMLEFNPDKIILGCTHYPYLIDEFVKYAQKDIFIDPANIFAEYIKTDLTENNMLNTSLVKGTEKFYVSANPKDFIKNAAIFYKVEDEPTLV